MGSALRLTQPARRASLGTKLDRQLVIDMHSIRLAFRLLAIAPILVATISLRAQDPSDELSVLDRQIRELAKVGKLDAAEPLTLKLLEAVKRRFGAESKEYADALLSVPVAGGRRPSEANMLLALKIFEKRLEADDPAIANVLLLLAQEYVRGPIAAPMGRLLGLDLILAPRFADAKPLIDRALAILEQRTGSDSVEYADGLMVLGQFSKGVGKLDEAEPQFQRSLSIFEKSLGVNSYKARFAHSHLSSLYRDLGRRDDQLRLLRRWAQLTESALGPDHNQTLAEFEHLANTLRKYCHDDEAATMEKSKLQRTFAKRMENFGSGYLEATRVLNSLGDLYVKLARFGDARRTYQRAIAAQGDALDHADAIAAIAEIDRLEGRLAEAEDGFRRAIAVLDQWKVPPRVAWLDGLVMIYRAQGRQAEADDMKPRTESVRADERRRRGCQD